MVRENNTKKATGYAWTIYKKKKKREVKDHDRVSHDGIVWKKIASADKTSRVGNNSFATNAYVSTKTSIR